MSFDDPDWNHASLQSLATTRFGTRCSTVLSASVSSLAGQRAGRMAGIIITRPETTQLTKRSSVIATRETKPRRGISNLELSELMNRGNHFDCDRTRTLFVLSWFLIDLPQTTNI